MRGYRIDVWDSLTSKWHSLCRRDGTYVGTAGDFGPQSQPLDLSSGRHRVEVRASGFHTMTFDADVRPGQVLPYQGTLQRN